jgi:hypothetical protein
VKLDSVAISSGDFQEKTFAIHEDFDDVNVLDDKTNNSFRKTANIKDEKLSCSCSTLYMTFCVSSE